jgi:hypothetical protein
MSRRAPGKKSLIRGQLRFQVGQRVEKRRWKKGEEKKNLARALEIKKEKASRRAVRAPGKLRRVHIPLNVIAITRGYL